MEEIMLLPNMVIGGDSEGLCFCRVLYYDDIAQVTIQCRFNEDDEPYEIVMFPLSPSHAFALALLLTDDCNFEVDF